MADIGSHWCDLAEFVTGKRIAEVIADLSIIHPYRYKPESDTPTFAAADEQGNREKVEVNTEDSGSVLIRFEDGTKGGFSVSQVSAGRKNDLSLSIDCEHYSMSWSQETPERLWVGYRDKSNETPLKDSELVSSEAQKLIGLPGGHGEAWADGVKNTIHNFYDFMLSGKSMEEHAGEFATFADGYRGMRLVEAILESARQSRWVPVHS
ncbi:hypothetical protein LJK88_18175 [Paenibacillus sp. P26]|nr:hypothetical protein LJK88_18175 [Paenibacillus sp. P26]